VGIGAGISVGLPGGSFFQVAKRSDDGGNALVGRRVAGGWSKGATSSKEITGGGKVGYRVKQKRKGRIGLRERNGTQPEKERPKAKRKKQQGAGEGDCRKGRALGRSAARVRDPECRASNDGRVATGKITPARAQGAERLVGSRGWGGKR
jgi:hypothetical protein